MPKNAFTRPVIYIACAAGVIALALVILSQNAPQFDSPNTSLTPNDTPPNDLGPFPFSSRNIGDAPSARPWITHLEIVDLDGDGLLDIIACDAELNSVRWLRQFPLNTYTETQLGDPILAPAHATTCDIDLDGDLDLLVASMGQLMPSNDQIGSVIILENDGQQRFANRALLENVARVTDVRGQDLDNDGDIDLVVGQFGYSQGEIRWMRNDGDWTFSSTKLLGLSGTIHTPIGDLDQDGDPDIVALVSQEWEEVHTFTNLGDGQFENDIIWGSTNEDYGSASLSLDDLDQDGDLDILYSNGDAFDYAHPGSRPWHGVQWLENDHGSFTFHRVGNFSGAYKPTPIDLNADGHFDLIAVSGFNDWADPAAISIQAWINDGQQNFTPVALAHTPTHLVALAVGDLDQDGKDEFVTGGLHAYPPFGTTSRITLWHSK